MKFYDLTCIIGNPYQTRIGLDLEKIEALAEDIKRNGLLQIPVGRPFGDQIQLAFGHNRLEAFKLLSKTDPNYTTMPVEVKVLYDEQMALIAWSENEARQQLNPVERSLAIKRFMDSFHWTQDRVAEKLNLSRPTIANMLRLLTLPQPVLENIKNGQLTTRQAMALLPFYSLPEKDQDTILADGDKADFLLIARSGQIDSDTIRMRLGEYLEELEKTKPRQLTLEAEPEEEEHDDPSDLLRQAVQAIRGERQIDTSFLQRKLRVSFLTAQRLVRVLRESGALAEPMNGVFPVLISPKVDPQAPVYPVAEHKEETTTVCTQTSPEEPEEPEIIEPAEEESEPDFEPAAEAVPDAVVSEVKTEPARKPEPAPKLAAEPEQPAAPMLLLSVIWYGDSAVMSCSRAGTGGLPKFQTFESLSIFNLGSKADELIPQDWKDEFIK